MDLLIKKTYMPYGFKNRKGTPFAFFRLFEYFNINPIKHVIFKNKNVGEINKKILL